MSDRVQELLREFAQVTTPETSATPTFQQHGHGNTIVHITGNIDAPVTVLPMPPWQPVEDTLGRLLRQAKPWAYRWMCLYGVLAAIFILLRVAQVWSGQGSLSAADAWLRQHDYWFVCKDMLTAALMASVILVCWRAIAGPYTDSRPPGPQPPGGGFKRDSKAFEDAIEVASTSQFNCQNREEAAPFRKPTTFSLASARNRRNPCHSWASVPFHPVFSRLIPLLNLCVPAHSTYR